MLRDRDTHLAANAEQIKDLNENRDRLISELMQTQAIRNRIEEAAGLNEKQTRTDITKFKHELDEVGGFFP